MRSSNVIGSRGFRLVEIGAAVWLAASCAGAGEHEPFAARPSQREQAVSRSRMRRLGARLKAERWARLNGVAMRRESGGQVRELMAVRDGRPIFYGTKNYNAAISTAANRIRNTSPYNLSGAAITIGLWDAGGALVSHDAFAGGRVSVLDGSERDPHATHVCGTMAASGNNPVYIGMAPAVAVDSYSWEDDVSEMTSRAASAPGQTENLYLSNHSYGYYTGWEWDRGGYYIWYGSQGYHASAEEEGFGMYVEEAGQWDSIVCNAPWFLPFKAAGNDRNDAPEPGDRVRNGVLGVEQSYSASLHPQGDGVYKGGYDTLGPVGTAKNIMTVGAVRDAVSGLSRSLSQADMTAFSSWGPADDGRIKPDIVANGYDVLSSGDAHDSDYYAASGTSMASPNACGSAALLVEYYRNLFPPHGAMRASTLKGLIIHSADDLGRPGPDYQYGWGLMNALAAAELLTDYAAGNVMRLSEAELTESSNPADAFIVKVSGHEPLRVTLCWTDPASPLTASDHDSRAPRLVNDLDLKIIGPSGTHYPYKLSYADPSANATTDSKNDRDNVEQVYIEDPVPGLYTVMIDFDGPLQGKKQWYSLVVSGVGFDSDGDTMPDFWERNYFAGSTNAVKYADADGDGANNLTEYIAGTDPTNAASVFAVTEFFPPPPATNAPFVLRWKAVEGRVYNVHWTMNLTAREFADISGDLAYPINCYTDVVERAHSQNYYRIGVRFGE